MELRIPASELNWQEATLLTGLVNAVLKEFNLKGTAVLEQLGDDLLWQVDGQFSTEERGMILLALKDINQAKGMRYLGSGPVAFYAARQANITTYDFNRHCLTIGYVDPDEWRRKLEFISSDHDGIWGKVTWNEIDPFNYVGNFSTDHSDYTIFRWNRKHYMTAEQYLQYRRLGIPLSEGLY